MGDLRSLDELLADDLNLSGPEKQKLEDERTIGATAILLHQRGDAEAARLLADVTSFQLVLWNSNSWGHSEYMADFYLEPHMTSQFSEALARLIVDAMNEIVRDGITVVEARVRPIVPKVSADWRQQLKASTGPEQSNQARRVRLEPSHPMEDGLHFTNEWEHRVYQVLLQRQADLPDNETLGIVPLPGMRVRGHTYEPDFLVTYRGRAGVIEIDGPHHRGRRSDDAGRERLLRNAGVKHIDRIDVSDTTQRAEVEKFILDFLKHLAA